MSDVLRSISRFSMVAFLLTSMLGIGLSLTLSQIIAPLRNPRLVAAVLVANCLLVPLIAVGTVRLFRLDEPFAIGLLLLGLAPGAPFLPKVVELAKGDLALSVGLMVLLMAGSVVCLPLGLPQLLPGVTIGLWQVARPLLLLMVLPLLTGLRNIAAALVIAEEEFRDPQVLVMLVIAAFAGLFLLIPITLAWGKGPAARPALTH